jgi:hypothetical protein
LGFLFLFFLHEATCLIQESGMSYFLSALSSLQFIFARARVEGDMHVHIFEAVHRWNGGTDLVGAFECRSGTVALWTYFLRRRAVCAYTCTSAKPFFRAFRMYIHAPVRDGIAGSVVRLPDTSLGLCAETVGGSTWALGI